MQRAILGTAVCMLVFAGPVAAQERGDVCEDPAADPDEFICGQLTVTLADDAEATIDEVIARSGPEAEVAPDSPDGPTYLLHVPVGEELRLVEQFAADADVAAAFLVQVGTHTQPTPAPGTPMPDTAVEDSAESPVTATAGLIAVVLLLGAFMLIPTRR